MRISFKICLHRNSVIHGSVKFYSIELSLRIAFDQQSARKPNYFRHLPQKIKLSENELKKNSAPRKTSWQMGLHFVVQKNCIRNKGSNFKSWNGKLIKVPRTNCNMKMPDKKVLKQFILNQPKGTIIKSVNLTQHNLTTLSSTMFL